MRLGPLQKHILKVSRMRRAPIQRDIFLDYYKGRKNVPSLEDRVNAVTKAIEKMIEHNLMVAEGVRTAEKFFIKSIKLTSGGRRTAKRLIGAQQRLPISVKKSKKHA
jgi:hypothetical protein